MVTANEDSACWTALDGSSVHVALREPTTPPWDPHTIVPTPSGGWVDLGAWAVDPTAVVGLDPEASRALGHTLVQRRRGGLTFPRADPVPLPEAARTGDVRPWPDAAGWAWTDLDTLYRRAPSGRIAVAGRAPGPIEAWDVGPQGATWFVAAGCLWLGGPRRLAHHVDPTVEAALGVPLEALEAGSLVFDDTGRWVAAAEVEATHAIHLGARATVGDPLGSVVGLSPAPVRFPSPRPARCVPWGDAVARVSGSHLELWRGDGQSQAASLAVDGPVLEVRAEAEGPLVVVTPSGVHAFDRRGAPVHRPAGALPTAPRRLGLHPTHTGRVWWSADGGVVPVRSQRVLALTRP